MILEDNLIQSLNEFIDCQEKDNPPLWEQKERATREFVPTICKI